MNTDILLESLDDNLQAQIICGNEYGERRGFVSFSGILFQLTMGEIMIRTVAVIGGGAAGMMAAITAGRCGAHVTVYERNDRVGKKILSTGNGKCNFSNEDMRAACYYGQRGRIRGRIL